MANQLETKKKKKSIRLAFFSYNQRNECASVNYDVDESFFIYIKHNQLDNLSDDYIYKSIYSKSENFKDYSHA